ncbi:hypothetical protein ACHAWO_000716 [Cyclotella atomus]|uniref:Uncharacterized protein n=1 Tax=Cyclotella atomus TaxID=382360 RepID=A0ABD3NIH5_9STRA
MTDGTAPIAHIMPPSLTTFFSHQKSWWRHLDPCSILWRVFRRINLIQKGRLTRLSWLTEYMQCSLTCSCERRYNDQVEGSEGSCTRRPCSKMSS